MQYCNLVWYKTLLFYYPFVSGCWIISVWYSGVSAQNIKQLIEKSQVKSSQLYGNTKFTWWLPARLSPYFPKYIISEDAASIDKCGISGKHKDAQCTHTFLFPFWFLKHVFEYCQLSRGWQWKDICAAQLASVVLKSVTYHNAPQKITHTHTYIYIYIADSSSFGPW